MSILAQMKEAELTIPANGNVKETTFLPVAQLVEMPELPQSAEVDTSGNEFAAPWLDQYIKFSQKMSPRAYEGFHEAIGLWILSTVAARRIVLPMGQKRFYPSLYITLTAPTTVFSKSTTVNTAYRLLRACDLDFLLTPDDSTPQAFINEMSGKVASNFDQMTSKEQINEKRRLAFAGQCGWAFEEFGMKIEAMMRPGGFMADFRGMLRVLDDGKERYEYKTMTRRDVIEAPYLALIANMTPADLKPHAQKGSGLWGDGFLARFAFITPPPGTKAGRGRFPNELISYPKYLIEPLKKWHENLGFNQVEIDYIEDDKGKPTGEFSITQNRKAPINLMLSDDAEDAFYNYHDALLDIVEADENIGDMAGSYGRFAEKAMRIAMLLASFGGGTEITLAHWARAQTIAETWREGLHNVMAHLEMDAPSKERKEQEKLLRIIERFENGATPSTLAKYDKQHSASEIADLCYRMAKDGSIGVVGKTRKGTVIYGILS